MQFQDAVAGRDGRLCAGRARQRALRARVLRVPLRLEGLAL